MSLLSHQIELLSPAKTAEIGREAILHGADAVYIGGPAFGARDAAHVDRGQQAGREQFVLGQRRPVLVDLRAVRSQSAEARALFAGPAATAVTVAVALVTSSPLSRVLGNFFLGFNRPEKKNALTAAMYAALADAIAMVVDAPRGVHLNLVEVNPEAPVEDS